MANRMLMVAIVRPIAISGDTSAIVLDRSARFSSTSCMRRPLVETTAAHQQAELFAARLGARKRWREAAVEHHGDAAGDLDEFVEILAGNENGGAAACEVEQRLADDCGGARIDAPGR